MLDCIHPDDLDIFEKSLQKSGRELTPWELEFRILPQGGPPKWVRGACKVRREPGGDTVWEGISLDITDRKAAENELLVQKNLWQEIIENLDQAVVVFDAERRLVTWNRHYPEVTNLKEGESLHEGKTAYEIALEMARNGAYGPGDPAELASNRLDHVWKGLSGTDVSFGDERSYDVRSNRLPTGVW